ncbi:hypothetical protein [Rhodocyclus tenuis]|uniref:hypothetical protein n=1 Tax=Rhodocyclus tenuis TaxID=1066 RepID=UPI0012927B03|nr:hypothetical protein [Rhodocyclus tenuis]
MRTLRRTSLFGLCRERRPALAVVAEKTWPRNLFAIVMTSSLAIIRAAHCAGIEAMDRESMIDLLVLDCFEKLSASRHGVWLLGILRDGFAGFAALSDDELRAEVRRRGLDIEPLDDPAKDGDDWEFPDADPDLVLALAASASFEDA